MFNATPRLKFPIYIEKVGQVESMEKLKGVAKGLGLSNGYLQSLTPDELVHSVHELAVAKLKK
jgi:hypothetical protein